MSPSKSRRRFVFAGMGLSMAAFISGWWFFKVRKLDIHLTISTLIRNELHYLTIAEIDLKKFSSELKYAMIHADLMLTSWSGILAPILASSNMLDYFSFTRQAKKQFAEYLCTEFLLSTDFFQNGADPSKPVRYIKYYYLNPQACNPLAEFK